MPFSAKCVSFWLALGLLIKLGERDEYGRGEVTSLQQGKMTAEYYAIKAP
jgi:hypothetical protein